MRRREFIALLGSAAAGASVSATAARARTPRVGILAFGYPDPSAFLTGFKDGLRDLGYEEGRSVELIIRSAGGRLSTLSSLATELVNLQVDIIVALPTTAGIAA
jgi:putative ABC transport system substrate-binding protein